MPCGFLILAAAAGPASGRSAPAGGWGAAIAFTIALLILFAVVLALLMRSMRHHLIDEPTRRHESASIDPWVEAGRRLGRRAGAPRGGERPRREREADDEEDDQP